MAGAGTAVPWKLGQAAWGAQEVCGPGDAFRRGGNTEKEGSPHGKVGTTASMSKEGAGSVPGWYRGRIYGPSPASAGCGLEAAGWVVHRRVGRGRPRITVHRLAEGQEEERGLLFIC